MELKQSYPKVFTVNGRCDFLTNQWFKAGLIVTVIYKTSVWILQDQPVHRRNLISPFVIFVRLFFLGTLLEIIISKHATGEN